MPDISKITLPSGNTYDIKDAVARSAIGGAIVIRGTTTTALVDNATTNPIQINGESYTAGANDAVFYGNKEFIFDGTRWHEFGDMSGIGEMGKVDVGIVTITPKGTNSASSVTFANNTTDTFVKSYPGVTSKLATTSVTGVSSSTTTASKATLDSAASVANGSLGTETSTRTANTPMWGATVTNETLSFTFKPLSTTAINIYTFTDVTVPIKNQNSTTVATGSLSSSGSGDNVMTGLGTPTTASAITALGTGTAAAQTFTGTEESYVVYPDT